MHPEELRKSLMEYPVEPRENIANKMRLNLPDIVYMNLQSCSGVGTQC